MKLGRDGIAGLLGVATSVLLLPHALGLPRLPIVPIGPGFYPALVLTFLAVASALLVVQDVVARRRSAAAGAPTAADGPPPAYGLVAAAFAVVAAYVVLMPLLGFRIATALFVATFQAVLEAPRTLRRWAALIAVALATSALTYLVFEHYLLVLLPRGLWTGW